ncbi:MAG: hypothetical protein JO097_02485 [Acidobacteriaceae bacterium]|nr:hypothetical protein [Acidobacteriaceae bacterium]
MLGLGVTSPANLKQAENLYKYRKFEQSLALLDAESADSATQFLLARIAAGSGDLKKATDILTKLTQEHPNNSDYFDWLGKVYGMRAEKSSFVTAPTYANRAREAFEEAVRLDGNNKDALSDLFDYYLGAPGILGGSIEKAAAIADKDIAINPPEGYLQKARLAEKARDLKAAESFYRQSVKVAPRPTGYQIALAQFLARQQRHDEADQVFAQAFQQKPDEPGLLFARARILVKSKRKLEEARDLLNRYLQSRMTVDDPAPEEARLLLEQIQ